MVIPSHPSARRAGFIMTDAVMAIAILLIAVLPVAFGFRLESIAVRSTYQRAVAMEIVDGEMEALASGPWRTSPEGSTNYPVHARAAVNLPPGQFVLTHRGHTLRLEWKPPAHSGIGAVVREVTGP